MNTTYITEKDKNGKACYYRVTDGKKKVISRAEYEANISETADVEEVIASETTFASETAEENEQMSFRLAIIEEDIPKSATAESVIKETKTVEKKEMAAEVVNIESIFEAVKVMVKATGTKHSEKMYLQNCKKCAPINYRNCTICSLMLNGSGEVTAIKFMGITKETRAKFSVYKLDSLDTLSAYSEKIAEQVNYVDGWYMNAADKNMRVS